MRRFSGWLAAVGLTAAALTANMTTAMAAGPHDHGGRYPVTAAAHVPRVLGVTTTKIAAAYSSCYDDPSPGNCDGASVDGSGCNSGTYYVVQSVPLYDNYTGQYSWSYGYLQLWWSDHCQTNWARLVINPKGSWDLSAYIQVQGGDQYFFLDVHALPPGAYFSQMVYAKNLNACTVAYIYPPIGSAEYQATNSQYSPPCS